MPLTTAATRCPLPVPRAGPYLGSERVRAGLTWVAVRQARPFRPREARSLAQLRERWRAGAVQVRGGPHRYARLASARGRASSGPVTTPACPSSAQTWTTSGTASDRASTDRPLRRTVRFADFRPRRRGWPSPPTRPTAGVLHPMLDAGTGAGHDRVRSTSAGTTRRCLPPLRARRCRRAVPLTTPGCLPGRLSWRYPGGGVAQVCWSAGMV